MATSQTITYDPSDPNAPEFTEEEQNSIEVGQQLEDAQSELLAGKYKDAEALEKAYIELQSKLGKEDGGEVRDVPEDSSDKPEEETEEQSEEEQEEEVAFDEETVNALMGIAGGEKGYEEMINWAEDNIPENEINMFNKVMDMQSPEAAFFAIHALRYAYQNNNYEADMIQGRSSSEPADVFRSQAQLVEAMSDPRYDNDPAFREDVANKLARSGEIF